MWSYIRTEFEQKLKTILLLNHFLLSGDVESRLYDKTCEPMQVEKTQNKLQSQCIKSVNSLFLIILNQVFF